VPWQVAFGPRTDVFSAAQRMAACVVLGEMDGSTYDWAARRWREKR